ncbi:dihydrolipoyl dehydrogenase [Elongatibacter sediminis]|uniref:Dihydrolipoyl dehydrogenase n=1 Tax=Elongatibacter sediminis TaxID=3119006 RepID=A0AAW9RLK3_9GAMM
MSQTTEVKVPDIGDFTNIPVIEVLISPGDEVAEEQSLVTLESDKATMEVPAPVAGIVREVKVSEGSAVSEGDVIAVIESEAEAVAESPAGGEVTAESGGEQTARPDAGAAADEAADGSSGENDAAAAGTAATDDDEAPSGGGHEYDVVVLGSGPGGYTAAFRAADLGLKVALVERYPSLGGVCLNVGCIPSKALLHTAAIIDEAAAMADHGVRFGDPDIDLERLREFKDGVVGKLTDGLGGMATRRGVEVVRGTGRFTGPNELTVGGGDEERVLDFAHAIIAAGSQSLELPGLPWGDPRLMDSTAALDLEDIPGRLLVIGGGIIGLEMACVYAALGSKVTVVELTPQLMPGADADLVRPLQQRIKSRYENIYLETRVTGVDIADDALVARFEGEKAPSSAEFDRVLVAVGRVPNGGNIGADAAGVEVDDKGFIAVDNRMRTNVPHIFAIGDIVGQPMLAHKATHEGKVAAEVCAGHKSAFDARAIPSVAYTDPEVAWVGVTETEAKAGGTAYGVGKFPWAASGRALGIGRGEGFTKLLFDEETGRIIGAGIVGPHAGDLVSECALAIEMGCEAADIGLTIHPHPTLSETVAFAAEVYEGTVTDLYIPRKK